MRFENAFVVDAPIDDVYAALLDVERAVPCVPGVQMLERSGEDAYDVDIKVAVGPISTTYRGSIQIVERDAGTHRIVFTARGRDSRDPDSPDTEVQIHLIADDGATLGTISADVQLSDTAAAIGQGLIKEVLAGIVETFSHNLTALLAKRPREAATADAAEAVRAAAERREPEAVDDAEMIDEAELVDDEGELVEDAEVVGEGEVEETRPPAADALPIATFAGPLLLARLRDPRILAAAAGAVVGFFVMLRRLRRRR